MADLTEAHGFTTVTSQTGALEVTWPAFTAAELHVWILLADPQNLDPSALHPERLLANLIRVPVDATAGRATVYVPTLRPLGVTLVGRDERGQLIDSPKFSVTNGPPPARTAPPTRPTPPTTPPTRPTPPTTPPTRPTPPTPAPPTAPTRIPLVFARAGSGTPSIPGTTPRLTEPGPPTEFEALRTRVAALTGSRPESPRPTDTAAGFGVKQRFTLTRLLFPADTLGKPRYLVAQQTFIGRSDLESWRPEPPSWAFPVPEDRDGAIDGLSPEDQVVFYALLVHTDSGWTTAPLTPSSPPFTDIQRPMILGDAKTRLEAALAQSQSDALTELIHQAIQALAPLTEGPA